MSSTEVSEAEKPPPAIVSVAPPASDVALGLKLLAVSARPCMVGSAGSPSPLPHAEVMLTVWAPESGGGTSHESKEAVTEATAHLHGQRRGEKRSMQPGTRALRHRCLGGTPLGPRGQPCASEWASRERWVAAKAAAIQGTWLMRLHGVGPTRTLASEGKSEPVPKAPVSSMLQSDPGACDVTVAAVMTGVRDRS